MKSGGDTLGILTPAHDKSTPDSSGRVFGGKDGHSATLYTHSDAQEETAEKKLLPCLSACTPNNRPEAKVRGNEDGSCWSC